MYNTDKKPYPILSFDFETSSLPETGGLPIQFASQLVDPYTLLPVVDNNLFSVYMQLEEGEEIHPEAFKVHGYTKEFLQEKGVPRAEAARMFFAWLKFHGFNIPGDINRSAVGDEAYKNKMYSQFAGLGQNLNFDIYFLDQWIGREARNMFHFKFIDLMPMAELINTAMALGVSFGAIPFRHPETGLPSISLTSQAQAFGIEISGTHDAAEDVQLAAAVYKHHVETLAGSFRIEFTHLQDQENKVAAENAAAATGQPVKEKII